VRLVNVTIVGGAGGVGASTAFNLIVSGGAYDIVLVDSRPKATTSHLMDFEQVLELSPGATVRSGTDEDVGAAEILVVTAAVPLTVNTSRLVYLEDNTRIVDQVADLLPPDWPGVILVVTNPVDPLVTRVQLRTGLDRRRVVGYTVNDSLRFSTGLAHALGRPPGSVRAWVLGEHGESLVALHDRVTIGSERVQPSPEEALRAEEFLRTWYERHVSLDSGRSSTWTSGLGVSRMVSAIVHGDAETWPASVVLGGEYGIEGVALSVPVTLGPEGVSNIHEWDLADDDLAALRASAEVIRKVVERIEQTSV